MARILRICRQSAPKKILKEPNLSLLTVKSRERAESHVEIDLRASTYFAKFLPWFHTDESPFIRGQNTTQPVKNTLHTTTTTLMMKELPKPTTLTISKNRK